MRIKILAACILVGYKSISCDICNIFEYANRTNQSYIGVFYRYRFLNGYSHLGNANQFMLAPEPVRNEVSRLEHHPTLEETVIQPTKRDFQQFQTVELRFNYSFKQKWNIQLIAPLLWNTIYLNQTFNNPLRGNVDTTLNVSGFGDPLVSADYLFDFYQGMTKHIFRPGIGLKLPFGRTNMGANGKIYDYELQPGTGSVDAVLRTSYLVTNDRWGLDAFANYRINSTGNNEFLLGNKLNLMVHVFYTIGKKEVKFLPKVGLYYEFASQDKFRNRVIDFSGGHTLFHQYGFDLMMKKVIIQAFFQLPLAEKLNGAVIGNAGRFSVGAVYNF